MNLIIQPIGADLDTHKMDSSIKTQVLEKTRSFFKETTIHGLPLIVQSKIHVLERTFWLIVASLATVAAVLLCLSNWNRFTANPTVVTLQKDFRNWDNVFPAATGCYISKWTTELADKYIRKKFGVNSTNPKYNYYMDFVTAVANASYRSLGAFKKFESDESLKKVDMVELAIRVIPEMSGTLILFDPRRKKNWILIMTELGLCFTLNSKFESHVAVKFRGITDKLPKQDEHILKCHYLNGLCYARYDSDPKNELRVYIHSYLDIVHATNEPPLVVKDTEELEMNYRMHETYGAPTLRNLRPSQRGCRFEDEPITDDIPVYSTSFCYMVCRYNMAMKYCGCRPFFYYSFGGKLCDAKGLSCLSQYAEEITKPPSKIGCVCPQPCNLITYIPMTPKRTVWQYGYFDRRITFRWGLLPPTTKYLREVLFGFEDLVVAFGGILALFLGVSFISGIEVIVFIVETIFHIFWITIRKPKNTRRNYVRNMGFNSKPVKLNKINVLEMPQESSFNTRKGKL